MADDEDQDAPPPMVIVRGPEPDRRVARIHGELSAAEAQRNAVSVACGLDFSARRAQTNATFEQLQRPLRAPPRQLSDEELLGGMPWSERADADARVDVRVEQGRQLAAVCPAGQPHGVCLVGVGRARCDGRRSRR